MKKEDFLQIFKSGFHKLNLKKLVRIGESDNGHGQKYQDYLGLFEFVPPDDVWADDEPIDYVMLKGLLDEFDKEFDNCLVRKFTRKIIKNDEIVQREVTRYIFDIVPKNILAFRFDRKAKTMKLVAKGYRMDK